MKAHHLICTLAAVSLALVAGCQKRGEDTSTGSTETTASTLSTGETGADPAQTATGRNLATEDREFLTHAAQGGLAEVALGSMAAQKATSPEVKRFANRMVVDHSKANDELKRIATRKGVTLPTELSSEHRELSDKLAKLSGNAFDEEYARAMVSDHEKDVKDFEKASRELKDADFKAWAGKTLPVLREHLDLAKQMYSKFVKT